MSRRGMSARGTWRRFSRSVVGDRGDQGSLERETRARSGPHDLELPEQISGAGVRVGRGDRDADVPARDIAPPWHQRDTRLAELELSGVIRGRTLRVTQVVQPIDQFLEGLELPLPEHERTSENAGRGMLSIRMEAGINELRERQVIVGERHRDTCGAYHQTDQNVVDPEAPPGAGLAA